MNIFHLFKRLFGLDNNHKASHRTALMMTEQEALNTIPDDWIKDIDPVELEEMANESLLSIIFLMADQLGVAPIGNTEKMITQLAKIHKISRQKEIEQLKVTSIQNSKIDIFIERYGDLFKKDKDGELSYSRPMLKKITGITLK